MGYYSEVVIACKQEGFKMFEKAWKEHNFKPGQYGKTDDDIYIIKWEWVKWYEGYPEIEAINDVMNELDEEYNEDLNYAYKFIRLGEETGDIDTRENDIAWEELEDIYPTTIVEIPESYKKIE